MSNLRSAMCLTTWLLVALSVRAELPVATGRQLAMSQPAWKLFVPDTYQHRSDDKADLLVHFHGDPQTVWNNAAYAKLNAIIVTVNYRGLSSVYSTPFADPSLFRELLDEALTTVRAERDVPDTLEWDQLAVSSFSAGYGAVRELLRSESYFDEIDALLAADSLYATTASDGTPLDSQMADYKRFADRARDGNKTFLFSHSHVPTPTYESTKDCGEELLLHLGRTASSVSVDALGTLHFDRHMRSGNFQLWGATGNDGPAHMAHLRDMGEFLTRLPLAKVATGTTAAAAHGPLAQQVEALLPNHVGAAVMAIDDGQTVFKRAWGKRRLDGDDPCTTATNFRLASVTKQFTATAVLLLVERGVIALGDTLDKFFPGGPDYWRQITIHHLLTHTSGLPDYEKLIPEGTTLQLSDVNVLALLSDTTEPGFEPGTKFAYSNSGYTLLGLIVEVAAERPFQRFLETEVLQPAGMQHSIMYVDGLNEVPERAYGHLQEADGAWTSADQSVTSAIRGDGGVYSSLDDLQRWLKALDGDFVLSNSSLDTMFTSHVKTNRGDAHYGYGWFIDRYRGERRVMHAGGTRGFSTMLQRFPDRRAAVVILLNRSDGGLSKGVADKIVDLLLFDGRE